MKKPEILWQIKHKIFFSAFFYKKLPKNEKFIVVQGASLGEAIFAIRLAKMLYQKLPSARFIFFTNTKSGLDYLNKNINLFPGSLVKVFPLDVSFNLNKLFKYLNLSFVVIIESEYWLNFINYVHTKKKAPVFVVNARLSDSSFAFYKWLNFLNFNSFKKIAKFYYTADYTKQNFLKLGVLNERLVKTPSFKIEPIKGFDKSILTKELSKALGAVKKPKFLFVAGSLHPSEAKTIFSAWQAFTKVVPEALMVIIPRHPNKRAEFLTIFDKHKIDVDEQKKTQKPILNHKVKDYHFLNEKILLISKFGVSRIWYQMADCVFVGGSLNLRGGQNFLEPIALKKFTATGPNLANFYAEKELFVKSKVLNIVKDMKELTAFLNKAHLKDLEVKNCQIIGYSLIKSNSKALQTALDSIIQHIKHNKIDETV